MADTDKLSLKQIYQGLEEGKDLSTDKEDESESFSWYSPDEEMVPFTHDPDGNPLFTTPAPFSIGGFTSKTINTNRTFTWDEVKRLFPAANPSHDSNLNQTVRVTK